MGSHSQAIRPPRQSRLRTFRPDIEGFRAVAILMVVIHHCGVMVFGGVDTSFVLSGFLVTSMLLREVARSGKVAFGTFYARRARRLLPVATVVIVATVVASWVVLPVFKLKSVGLDGLFAALSAVNFRLAATATDYFAANSTASPFQHFWSLSIEEQFYLLWPLLFLLIVRTGQRWLFMIRLGLILGLAAAVSTSLYASIITTPVSQSWAYFGFHTRAWELAIGALVAVGAELFARMWRPLAAGISWAGLGVIAVGSVVISHSSNIPGSVMVWPVAGTALFIIGGCAAPRFGAEVLLGRTPLRLLGRLSYGWYLWHWPALVLVPYAVGHPLTVWQNMLVALFALGLAAVTYYGIEVKVKRITSLVEVPRRGLAMGARLVFASVLGTAILVTGTVANAQPVHETSLADPAHIGQQVTQAAQATSLSPLASSRLNGAKDDLYPGCIADIKDTVAVPCNLGAANGKRQMVLLGSSLAWQWIPALSRIAQQDDARLAVLTKGSCPAERYSVPIESTAIDGGSTAMVPYTQCDTWQADAYRKIAALHPNLVVMSSRVTAQATPAAIKSSVQYFTHLGAKVAVIGETPSFQFDVPTCLAKHRSALQHCVVPRHTVFADTSHSDMAATADREAGATVIDPLQWLCTSAQCPTVIDDQVAYWDAHHLSASFTVWLSPLLAAQLPK